MSTSTSTSPDQNLTPEEKVVYQRYLRRQQISFPVGFIVGAGTGIFISRSLFKSRWARWTTNSLVTLTGLGCAYVWSTRKFMEEVLELEDSPLANQLLGHLKARGLLSDQLPSEQNKK